MTAFPEVDMQAKFPPITARRATVFSRSRTNQHFSEERRVKSMEREAHVREIFEAAGMGLATADLRGFVLSSNAALQKMVGYSAEELSKMHFRDFTHPDDAAIEVEKFDDLIQGKIDQYTLDKRYYSKSRDIIWVHVVLSMLRRSAGDAYVVALIENVTDRKRAEEHDQHLIAEQAARAEAEAKLEFLNSVLHHMPAGVAIVEAPSGNVLLTNRKLNEMLELSGTSAPPATTVIRKHR